MRSRQSVLRRCVSVVVLVTLTVQVTACHSWYRYEDPEPSSITRNPERERILGVTTPEGEVVRFDERGVRVGRKWELQHDSSWVHHDTIHAYVEGEPRSIALADVSSVFVERRHADPYKAAGLIVGILGPLFLLLFVSCIESDGCAGLH